MKNCRLFVLFGLDARACIDMSVRNGWVGGYSLHLCGSAFTVLDPKVRRWIWLSDEWTLLSKTCQKLRCPERCVEVPCLAVTGPALLQRGQCQIEVSGCPSRQMMRGGGQCPEDHARFVPIQVMKGWLRCGISGKRFVRWSAFLKALHLFQCLAF
ncbi:hypothetical protein CEP88_13800 [Roseobacter denitrificans]|nr:hypothetical protein CEP88_13800 [Roseobacter denitrificans]